MVPMLLLGFYRHPSMDMDRINDVKLELLLSKLYHEKNQNIYLVGDFNFELLKVNRHDETSGFFSTKGCIISYYLSFQFLRQYTLLMIH